MLRAALSALPGLTPLPSATNFILVRCEHPDFDAPALARRLLMEEGIAIRVCDNFTGLDERYFRIAVRTDAENARLLSALDQILGQTPPLLHRSSRPTPAIMFQGTGSDVGKSVLAAGLCRILLQDGLRVAPFKAQNMSLNSYVTRDGGEMGRAQVVQAQACRLDPETRMNPVLLKPGSDTGSQVIVNGKPVADMAVRDYVNYKEKTFTYVCQAYDSLAAEFEALVLEGAGSPGEVNLKTHDIVNMRMARYANTPVLLVGDIDRGGVYASFIGHLEVMAEWERQLTAGFVVNRFHGDASLLADAHNYVQCWSGKKVLGVVPWIDTLGLPQEDSVSFKAGLYKKQRPETEHVEIVLIDLPHISNFTDLEPLIEESDVHLRVLRRAGEIGRPDAVILPGSKNVAADLEYLRRQGLADEIIALSKTDCEIVGICGGFQILGREISDPHGIENTATGPIAGLGLLDMDTELAKDKTLKRQRGIHRASGLEVRGYEIHHGISRTAGAALLQFENNSGCGLSANQGHIWGAYLHGIFDSDAFRRWFINRLRLRKGLHEPDLDK